MKLTGDEAAGDALVQRRFNQERKLDSRQAARQTGRQTSEKGLHAIAITRK